MKIHAFVQQRRRNAELLLCRIATVVCLALFTPSVHAAQPWDTPFSKDTRALLDAAQRSAQPGDASAVLLLEDHRYTIDREGRTASTIRKVYRILKDDAVEDWAAAEQPYQPWYEQIPQIRARVIRIDGTVHWLDPKTIADAPVQEFDANIFSDRRVLRAPLPAVQVGSVVEYEIGIREKAPLLDAGVTRRIQVTDSVPLERFHVLIEADSAIELRTVARLIPESSVRRTATNRGTQVECNLGPLEARKDFEFNLPPELPRSPYLSFSTGKSWQAIATRYDSIVDQQIKSGDLKSILADVDFNGTPAAVAARLASKLHKEIRYTGVEFGDAAIVPRSPAETLQRKYGDCKDKSALLVAMLRAAGLDAHVALLAVGFATDIDEDLPGFGVFDHAIVHVSTEPALWIDATAAETRVGFLPAADQGRLALIARSDTKRLVRTPEAEAKDNWERHTIEVKLSDYGSGEFTETIEMGGAFEADMRTTYGGDRKSAAEILESYVKQNFMAKSLGTYEVTSKDDLSGPFRMKVQALKATRASSGLDDAAVALFPALVFERLPYALRTELEGEGDTETKKQRKHDFVFPQPYVAEYRYRITAPPLFKPNQLPTSAEVKLGPALYSREYRATGDGAVEAVFRFSTGKRRLTPTEFAELREGLRPHTDAAPELIVFVPETSEHLAVGQIGKALALLRDHVSRAMDEPTAHVRMSRTLITAGLGDAARAEAMKAVELNRKSSLGWQALGWAYQHDLFGRRFQGNWDRKEAEASYRKALEADPDDNVAKVELAILLEHNEQGHRYGKGVRLDETMSLYREVLKSQSTPDLHQNLAVALLYAGRIDEAKDEMRKAGPEKQANLQTVIVALQHGAAKAIVGTQTTVPDPKTRALHLLSVSFTLMQMRRYELANVTMAAAARLESSAEFQKRAELLRKLKRYEDCLLPASDPRSPAQRLFLQILLGEETLGSLRPLFTPREEWTTLGKAERKLKGQLAGVRHQFTSIGIAGDTVVDFFLSLLDLEKDGEESEGYRITATAAGSTTMPAMYVVRESGEYRILGSADSLEHVGELVLELLDKKEIKRAQWWLDKVLPDIQPMKDIGGIPATRTLWSGMTPETRGPAAIKIAAASLIGRYSASEKAIQILSTARKSAADTWDQTHLDLALCESLARAQKWQDLLTISQRLWPSKTLSEEAFRYAIQATGSAKTWKDLESTAQRRLRNAPTDRVAIRAVAMAKARLGDHAGAADWIRKMTAGEFPGLDDRIFESWNAILAGKPAPTVLADLKKSEEASADYYYTVAMLQAALRMPEDAHQSLRLAVAYEDFSALGAEAWAVYGKICEQYGFSAEAAAAFARVPSDTGDDEIAAWARAVISRNPF